MEIRILCILVAMTVSSVTSVLVPLKRYGGSGGGSRFKRPSFDGGFQHQAPPHALPLLQQPRPVLPLHNNPSNVYGAPAPGPILNAPYSANGRPFGLPQEQPRQLSRAFTYKIPAADPPPPPVKSGYVSKPRSDYIIRLNGGSGGLSVLNRPAPVVSVAQPPSASPPIFVNEAPPAFRPAQEIVNVHPPLTSVYVISANSKNEGAKEAFVGLHREPVFGSTPQPGVIKPLTPDVVYSPNHNPSESGRGDEFKPMYIFGPVFYPKTDNASKDNAESESNANTVLKSPSEAIAVSTTTTSTTTTTATSTTPAPSSSGSGSDSAGDDSKNADSETSVSSDESLSSSGGKKNSGGRGILKVIKGLLGVDELADDLDETISRADDDEDEKEAKTSKKAKKPTKLDTEKIDEPEVEEVSNSTSKVKDEEESNSTITAKDDEEEPEVEDEEITSKEKERVKKAPVIKSKINKPPHSSVSLASLDRKTPSADHSGSSLGEIEAEDKKQSDVNGESGSVSHQPQQHLETVEHASLPHSAFNGQHGMNEEDPDPIVGPLQIGFISGSPPGAGANQFGGAMQPYFYPAGIPLYNDRPPLNPFSPTGTGFSHEPNEGFEADHTRPHLPFQQQRQPQLSSGQPSPSQRFTPEMIQHEQEKIRENFERQRNQEQNNFERRPNQQQQEQNFENQRNPQQNFENEQQPQNFERQHNQQQNFERYRPSLTEEQEKINEHVEEEEQLQSIGGEKEESVVDSEMEQGITVDNKREVSAQDSENSFDHTDRYSEVSSSVAATNDDHLSTSSIGSSTVDDYQTTTAYADMKHTNFYRDASPASQTTSPLHVEEASSVKAEEAESPPLMYNRFAVQNVQEDTEEKTISPVVQSSYASVSTRKPFPHFNHHRYQGHFRPKNRNYVAPTTYRPSYPRTPSTEQPPIEEDNSLDDHKDSSATLYNSINYEEDSTTSGSAVTPAIQVEPYGERQHEEVQSDSQDQMQESTYGSRISNNKYDEK